MQIFTEAAHEAIRQAIKVAARYGCCEVAPEHLAIAILMGSNNATKFLADLGFDTDQIILTIEHVLESTQNTEDSHLKSYSDINSDTRLVIQSALSEAFSMGSVEMGTDHLLLGLLSKSDLAITTELLQKSGLNLQQIRAAIKEKKVTCYIITS